MSVVYKCPTITVPEIPFYRYIAIFCDVTNSWQLPSK